MGEYRQIHMKIWKDAWFLDLEPEHKLLFIYLFSNERTSISGIYELSKRIMVFESGLSHEDILSGLIVFEKAGKVFYDDGIVWIKSLRKFYDKGSSFVVTKMDADIAEIPDCKTLSSYCEHYKIPYTYPIHTLSKPTKDPIHTVPIQSNVMYSNVIQDNVSQDNVYDAHAENNPSPEVMAEIASVVKDTLAPGFNEDRFENAAQAVMGLDAVDKIAGFAEWWQRNTYYNDNGKPALKTFIGEFQNYLDGVERTSKINGQSEPALTETQINIQKAKEKYHAKQR